MSTFKNRPKLALNQQEDARAIMDHLVRSRNVIIMPFQDDPNKHPGWPAADFAVLTGMDDLVLRVRDPEPPGISWFDYWYKATGPAIPMNLGLVHAFNTSKGHLSELAPARDTWRPVKHINQLLHQHGIKLTRINPRSIYPTLDEVEVIILYSYRHDLVKAQWIKLPLLIVCHRNSLRYSQYWPTTRYRIPHDEWKAIYTFWAHRSIPFGYPANEIIGYRGPVLSHPMIAALPKIDAGLSKGVVPVITLIPGNQMDPLYLLDQQPPGSVTPKMLDQMVMDALADPVCQANQKIIGF